MIILLSPSKTLDFESPHPTVATTTPLLAKESVLLIHEMQKKSVADIRKLMDISEKLAELNHQRYQSFGKQNSRPCIFAFKGDVYEGLKAESLTPAALNRAQSDLRILSGLYGVLRPFDLIEPYRLEMGLKLATSRGKNLYQFWGERITQQINQTLEEHKNKTIINLASEEYFSAIHADKLKGKLITPVFKEAKGNQLKVIGLFAKKARGMMARWLLSEKDMYSFNEAGYSFYKNLSTQNMPIFIRKL